MKRIAAIITLFILLFTAIASGQKVGLVLSGGGAKGAAHIGVIKALEENNIPIDYVTGTSAGAIVGSLYAMGYTPEEMVQLMLSDQFSYWQTGTVENEYQYYFTRPDPTPQFGHFSIDMTDSLQVKANFLPESLINPIQMNQAFMGLFSQAAAKAVWNFDNLFVPFRCVASDVYGKKPIIFKNGDLGDAVRASMTFPFFFQPIWRDSVPLFDGGIYDNFPVGPMKEAFHPDFIFGSSVAGGNNKPSTNPYNQIESMIMQKTEYDIPDEEGIMLKFSFPNVSLLDFQKARDLMNIGYKRTMQMMDSIKARIPRRVELSEINARRKAYRDSLPPLVFHNIYITGINEAQRKYIEAQLHRDDNKDFTMEDFKRAYFKMLTYSKIKEILPHAVYNWKEKKFDLYLDVKIREEIKIGFGGNVSSYQANQLFLGVGYQYLGYYAADVNTNFQVGNSFSGVLLNGRVYLLTGIPTYLNIQGAFSDRRFSESQSLFYEDVLPAFIRQKELYAKLKLGFPFLNRAKAEIGIAYGHLNDDYFQTSNMTFSNASSDRSWYNLFSGSLSIDQNSLNYILYPTSGQKHSLIAQYVKGNEYFAPSPTTYASSAKEIHAHSWLQMKGEMQHYYNISSHLNLGLLGEVVISSKNLMSNYTSSVLQAPAFTPTIHSKIVFNEAFRANQYAAFGISPVVKLSKLLHFRVDMYGFAPLYEIKKEEILNNNLYTAIPYYGKFLQSFKYMGEAALVLQLPFATISFYGNGYSYPSKNFNFGINIGYLIFNPKMID